LQAHLSTNAVDLSEPQDDVDEDEVEDEEEEEPVGREVGDGAAAGGLVPQRLRRGHRFVYGRGFGILRYIETRP